MILLDPLDLGAIALSPQAAAELAHAILSLPGVQATGCARTGARASASIHRALIDEMSDDSMGPADESELQLIEQLKRGEFTSLVDPRLRALLLREVAWWWPAACGECCVALFDVLGEPLQAEERVTALEQWRAQVAPDEPPPAEWEWALSQVRGGVGGIVLAMDEVLRHRVSDMPVLRAECLLARLLGQRLPTPHAPAVKEALTALSFLEQWSP